MAISVVQSVSGGQGTATLNFSSPVTTGNSVILIPQGYNSGTTSSSPTYNGSTPTGSTVLAQLTSNGTYYVYSGIWLMPNLTGGSTGTGITITSGGTNGYTAVEVSGLGSAPQLDVNGGYSIGNGATSNTGMPSGSTPALSASSALLIGTGAAYGVGSYTTPGGWTNLPFASYSCVQYQIVTGAAGNTYNYNPSGGSAVWGSIIVAITQAPAASNAMGTAFLNFF